MLCLYYFKKKNRPHLKHKAKRKPKELKEFQKLSVDRFKENLKGSQSQLSEEQRGNTGVFIKMIPSQIFLTIS